MSKRHFEAIAAALRDERETALAMFEPMHAAGIAVAAERLATEFARFNPRFDRARFLAACGL